MSTLRVYLSHSMRGTAGPNASQEIQDENCERIKLVAMTLRYKFGGNVEFYVPAENETFVQIAYKLGLLTVPQILEVDCKIIDKMDVVICNVEESKDDVLQGGRLTEMAHAAKTDKPSFVFDKSDEVIAWLTDYMAGHN